MEGISGRFYLGYSWITGSSISAYFVVTSVANFESCVLTSCYTESNSLASLPIS